MSKFSLFVVLSIIAASNASIVQASGEIGNIGGGHGEFTPSLTWEQFKESCLHPEQFNNQTPPLNIRLQCTDVSREFIAMAPGQVPLPGTRKVISAVFSNKYNVNAEQTDVPYAVKGGSCMKFKEVEKTVTVDKQLRCDDILGIKSSLAEYCASNLTIAKQANPKLVDSRDTGRMIDTCSSGAISDLTPGNSILSSVN
jgi:hypothetical protein